MDLDEAWALIIGCVGEAPIQYKNAHHITVALQTVGLAAGVIASPEPAPEPEPAPASNGGRTKKTGQRLTTRPAARPKR